MNQIIYHKDMTELKLQLPTTMFNSALSSSITQEILHLFSIKTVSRRATTIFFCFTTVKERFELITVTPYSGVFTNLSNLLISTAC